MENGVGRTLGKGWRGKFPGQCSLEHHRHLERKAIVDRDTKSRVRLKGEQAFDFSIAADLSLWQLLGGHYQQSLSELYF